MIGQTEEYTVKNLKYFTVYKRLIDTNDDIAVRNELDRLQFKLTSHLHCNIVAENGHLETLKWLRENGCPWNEWTCASAAFNGHLETLKWARENGCPWNEWTCANAAKNGQIETLKWARENGCPWNEVTCTYAAGYGHLETLKWLRENGCPWDEVTCRYAAENGQIETLKWARGNGCPWNELTCTFAAINGHIEVLIWALNNGCPCSCECSNLIVKHNGTFMTHQQRKDAITFKLRSYAKAVSRLLRVFEDFMEVRYSPPGVYLEQGGSGYADGLCRWEQMVKC
jgi:hypothetical protein